MIRDALELLRKDGWTQGSYVDAEGRHCMLGAAYSVGQKLTGANSALGLSSPLFSKQLSCLHRTCEAQYGTVDIIGVNDVPGRTFAEIETIMEKAAVLEEEMI